ncbi:hypothetical protein AB0F31_17725, partial [Streptomyces griseus]|uniref:hypothetical protein n=1 Tax=Streptomyces griseus TaxID=1911 RepID=UPI0033C8BAF4
ADAAEATDKLVCVVWGSPVGTEDAYRTTRRHTPVCARPLRRVRTARATDRARPARIAEAPGALASQKPLPSVTAIS